MFQTSERSVRDVRERVEPSLSLSATSPVILQPFPRSLRNESFATASDNFRTDCILFIDSTTAGRGLVLQERADERKCVDGHLGACARVARRFFRGSMRSSSIARAKFFPDRSRGVLKNPPHVKLCVRVKNCTKQSCRRIYSLSVVQLYMVHNM